jgi:hypothetical protein
VDDASLVLLVVRRLLRSCSLDIGQVTMILVAKALPHPGLLPVLQKLFSSMLLPLLKLGFHGLVFLLLLLVAVRALPIARLIGPYAGIERRRLGGNGARLR